MPETKPSEATNVFVARQPILDRAKQIKGYELLYRAAGQTAFNEIDPTLATSSVIANSLHTIGLGRLVGQNRAFINFERRMLVNGFATLLPPKAVVIEVLRGLGEDDEMVLACQGLKKQGFQIALDDFAGELRFERMVDLADILKVDFQKTTEPVRERFAEVYGRRGLRMLAQKVETPEEFASAREMGYELFQGYFFAKPQIVAGKEISGFKLNYLRVLSEVNKPDLKFERLGEVMQFEPALIHKLLRYVNSACFGLRREIGSVRHALTLLGEHEVRKWVSLVVLAGMAANKPTHLVVNSVVRGRFCEQLSTQTGLKARQAEMFLLGMYSMLDAVLDRPMVQIVKEVPLAIDIRAALLRSRNTPPRIRDLLAAAVAVEEANWDEIEAISQQSGVSLATIKDTYVEAVSWAEQVFQS